MDRVHNIPQFLQWLKERKRRKQEAENRKCNGKEDTAVSHAANCRCRRCMRLPQLPREHRRQQQILRTGESPEHVYEEIPPELVSPHLNTNRKHLSNEQNATAKINELYRANAKAQVKSSDNVLGAPQNQPDNQDSSVNLGNLDFRQAKEFGGFLVVPLRDRMVFHPVPSQPAKEPVSEQTVLQPDSSTDYVNRDVAPKNLTEFREVLKEHVKLQARNSLPKKLHIKDIGQTFASQDNLAKSGDHLQTHPDDKLRVHQAKREPDLTANQDIKKSVENVIPQTKTVSTKPKSSSSKSAFTRYIPSIAESQSSQSTTSGSQPIVRTQVRYNPQRGSVSTDTSEDSGGYFQPDDVMNQSSKSARVSQGSSSDRSNDTYNEYDVKSEGSSNDYDVFLQKAQQVRGFESNIQAIVRESESDYSGSCSSGKSSCSSPLSMLNIDDILALVSSDDHSQLLSDIMFSPQPDSVALLKQRISPVDSAAPYEHQAALETPYRRAQEPSKTTLNSPEAQSPSAAQSKLSCRVTTDPVPPRRSGMTNRTRSKNGNRLLGDLMRANHDRQLLY